MRIIAGTLKGRRLQGPPAQGVRPTSDRLRETVFNILRDDVEGGRVLDGFAGTGAMGLEAWSRGAATVTFVERDRRALAVLRANVAACGASEACAIIADDFIGLAARQGGRRGRGTAAPSSRARRCRTWRTSSGPRRSSSPA